jgi:hypothetical protein
VNKRCKFTHQKSDGEFSERTISNWKPSPWPDSIDAFCEERNEDRSFNLKRMTRLVDLATGEVISDPWTYFGAAQGVEGSNERKNLDILTWEALPAIKALKFFTITTRDFSKRERLKVVQFVEEVCRVSAYSKEEIGEWLQKLWCANLYDYADGKTEEYEALLRAVPASLMARCQDYALWIARGSGRKQPDSFWLLRIDSEFSRSPHALPPKPRQVD